MAVFVARYATTEDKNQLFSL